MSENSSSKSKPPPLDLLIVGGGLSGGLIAACAKFRRPEWQIKVLEREALAGGHHTWSFHGSDIPAESWPWLRPLVSKSWGSHSVAFPEFERQIDSSYHSIRSADFHERISEALGESLLFSTEATEVGPGHVRLASGDTLEARAVIDARGFSQGSGFASGFQKFVGLDVELAAPHDLPAPILMDARVPQLDGYRFFYVLPWSEKKLLVEDTRYSDSPALNVEELKIAVVAYCLSRGWQIEKIGRSEKGVLPIPLSTPTRPPNAVGARGNTYQDTTGFTLPDSVRLAETITGIPLLGPGEISEKLRQYDRQRRPSRIFFRALNRMLFRAAPPASRYLVLQKFYRLPAATIQRFYAGRVTWRDIALILSGKPPVPIWRGISAAFAGGGRRRA